MANAIWQFKAVDVVLEGRGVAWASRTKFGGLGLGYPGLGLEGQSLPFYICIEWINHTSNNKHHTTCRQFCTFVTTSHKTNSL